MQASRRSMISVCLHPTFVFLTHALRAAVAFGVAITPAGPVFCGVGGVWFPQGGGARTAQFTRVPCAGQARHPHGIRRVNTSSAANRDFSGWLFDTHFVT